MAQIQKEHIRKSILQGGRELFALQGYNRTSISEVAGRTGLSVGNIYRYFDGKEGLLLEILPPEFTVTLRKRMEQKIFAGSRDIPLPLEAQRKSTSYREGNLDFMNFLLENRYELLILFKHPGGTPYETFKDELLDLWVELVLRRIGPPSGRQSTGKPGMQQKFDHNRKLLRILFEGYIALCMTVLVEGGEDEDMIDCLMRINRYHLAGIAAIMEEPGEER